VSHEPYGLKKPCPLCPFRSDVKPYLSKPRVREILRALDRSEFPCHETTGAKPGSATRSRADEMHCAGALILLEKVRKPSQMMRISERLGLYDRTTLDMSAPVFDSLDEMIAAKPARRTG
jgi:hypothetical protein